MKRILKWLLRRFLQVLLVLASVLILLEVCYRFQVMDFYKNELTALNEPEQLKADSSKRTLLVFGDSFAANHRSFVSVLRTGLPAWRVINSAIPGTGIHQANLIAGGRLEDFQPDAVILQLYVGNDLLDARPPINWSTQGWLRNGYHLMGRWLLVVPYLNYRAGQWFNQIDPDSTVTDFYTADDTFDPEHYSPREKRLFGENPNFLEESVRASGTLSSAMDQLQEGLEDFLASVPESVPVIIAVVPHEAQLHESATAKFEQLGAIFDNPASIREVDYSFVRQIREQFDSDQVSVVNLLEGLREKDTFGAPLYLPNDPHLSPLGHEVVSTQLLEAMKRKGVITP